MSKTAVITTRVDEETLARVDQVAKATGRSRAWFAEKAIREAAEREADFLAFVQVGIDAADRGDLIPHEQVVAEIEQMIARHRARAK
jgi:predicted transcriptional regulator